MTKGHIRTQFLTEAILLSLIGGIVGSTVGALPVLRQGQRLRRL